MAARRCCAMVLVMVRSHQHNRNIAASAFELRRAAGRFQHRASAPGAVAALPLALADVEKALERLAVGVVKAAHAVEERDLESGTDALSPEARALHWHLFHLAARLRGAEDACPDARRWARELLAQHDIADDEEQATDSPPVLARRLVARGDAVAQ
jgi:hypothetical protein